MLAWLAATAVSLVGCRGGVTAARAPTTAQAPDEGTGDAAWEYKTIEVDEAPDRDRAIAQMKETMQKFQQEGWLVLAISKPLPQPDGTIHRSYSLKKARR